MELSFLERLSEIYLSMDMKYQEAVEFYGFDCRGCDESCCLTLFYHHTFLEYLYIMKGFDTLQKGIRTEVEKQASYVLSTVKEAEKSDRPPRIMCPFNFDGLCIIYSFRPMICRLHGIPHEFKMPGKSVIYGPGCRVFDEQCDHKGYFKFDRTSFYIKMAGLENEFKQASGITGKFKMTIAEMILEGRNKVTFEIFRGKRSGIPRPFDPEHNEKP